MLDAMMYAPHSLDRAVAIAARVCSHPYNLSAVVLSAIALYQTHFGYWSYNPEAHASEWRVTVPLWHAVKEIERRAEAGTMVSPAGLAEWLS